MGIFADTIKALRDSVTSIGKRCRELRAQINDLERKRDALQHAPLARAEVAEALDAWVERQAAKHAEAMASTIGPLCRRADALLPMRLDQSVRVLAAAEPYGSSSVSAAQLDAAMAFLFPAEMKAALGNLVQSMEWPAAEGLQRAERARKVEALEVEIGKLRSDLNELLADAAAAGVTLTEE